MMTCPKAEYKVKKYLYLGGKGDDEAEGLPKPVVGEGGLLLRGEQVAVQGVDLGLPDGVTDPPQRSKHENN